MPIGLEDQRIGNAHPASASSGPDTQRTGVGPGVRLGACPKTLRHHEVLGRHRDVGGPDGRVKPDPPTSGPHILRQAVCCKDVGLVGPAALPGVLAIGLRIDPRHVPGSLPRKVEGRHQGHQQGRQGQQAQGIGIRIAIRGHGSASVQGATEQRAPPARCRGASGEVLLPQLECGEVSRAFTS